MSIIAITGVPGTGKSYYAVSEVKKLLDGPEDIIIISNIEGTQSIRDRRYVYFERFDGSMFTVDGFNAVLNKYRDMYQFSENAKCVLFFDECQQILSDNQRSSDVHYFFDYHRHLGIDVYLITQNIDNIHRRIRRNCEIEFRAVPPHLSIVPGYFWYQRKSGKTVISRFKVKRRKEVFALYQSFKYGDKGRYKGGRMLLKLAIPVLILVVLVVKAIDGVAHMGDSVRPKTVAAVVPDGPPVRSPGGVSGASRVDPGRAIAERGRGVVHSTVNAVRAEDGEIIILPPPAINDLFEIVSYSCGFVTYRDLKHNNATMKLQVAKFIDKYFESDLNFLFAGDADSSFAVFMQDGVNVRQIFPDS